VEKIIIGLKIDLLRVKLHHMNSFIIGRRWSAGP
jgi:hypothetical protein